MMPETNQLPLSEKNGGANRARNTPTCSWLTPSSTGDTLDSTVRKLPHDQLKKWNPWFLHLFLNRICFWPTGLVRLEATWDITLYLRGPSCEVEIIWKWCNDFSFYDTVHWPRQAQLAGGTLYLQGPPCYPGRNHVKTIQWFLFVWHCTLTSSGAAFWWKIRFGALRDHLFDPWNEIKWQHKQLAFSRFGSPRGKVDVDQSRSLFYFIPQEKNITVKLARLGARQRSR